MSNIDNIIKDIREVNCSYNYWIRNENGDIDDNIICGNIIPFLEDLKEYEVDMSQDEIKDFLEYWGDNYTNNNERKYWGDNTYNTNANIDHDIDYRIANLDDGHVLFIFMVHRFGDIRGNYTDYAICKFDYVEEIFEFESVIQCKSFGEHYIADINIFSECYNVYDTNTMEDVGEFYEIEVEHLLTEIENRKEH